jgi:hypothetical protein
MSNPIIATVHADTEINSIRNSVAAKNDTTPYVLLPIRIETRFMLVDKPLLVNDTYVNLFADLSDITRYLIDLPFPPEEIVRFHIDPAITVKANALNTKISQLGEISVEDKLYLTQAVTSLEEQIKETNGKIILSAKSRESDKGELNQLGVVLNQVQETRKNLISVITSENETKKIGEKFLNHLTEINAIIAGLATEKLGTDNYKEKRKLFTSLDNQLETIQSKIKETRSSMLETMTMNATQLTDLRRALIRFSPGLSLVKKNLPGLKSKYKTAEFLSKTRSVGLELGKLKKEIDLVLRPRVTMHAEFKVNNARTLLAEGTELLHILMRFNTSHDNKTIGQQKFRAQLTKRFNQFESRIAGIIEGTDLEKNALHDLADKTQKTLLQFSEINASFEFKKQGEQKLQRDFQQKIEKAIKHVSMLTSDKKSGIPDLTQKSLARNSEVFENTTLKIKALNKVLQEKTENRDFKETENLFRQIIQLNAEFKTESRDLHILPTAKLKTLKKQTRDLEKHLDTKLKTIGAESPQARKAVAEIRATADIQVSDDKSRLSAFVNEERSAIAFTKFTKTVKELWVRIYPDDIAIHTHENALTETEVESGKAYWYEIWAAGEDAELKLAAWRAIVAAYGPQRAAWIVKSLEPQESESIAVAFDFLGGNMISAYKHTSAINEILKEGAKANINPFDILQSTESELDRITKQIKNITVAHDTSLQKSGKLLSETQALFQQIFADAEKISREKQPITEKDAQAFRSVQKKYANIIEQFSAIRPIKAKEIIETKEVDSIFPNILLKEKTWSKAPHSRVMPNRFVVGAMRNGSFRYLEAGKELGNQELIVGLDPSTFDSTGFAYDADKNLIVEDSIRWMTDFNVALQEGMAVSFELNEDDWNHGFDKLFVLGVKNTNAQQGKKLLEDLLENHHYAADGASFLPTGTATNNTKAGQAGYKSVEDDPSLSFSIERNNENANTFVSNADYPTDGERLASALGIRRSVLAQLQHNTHTGVSDALNLNKALYHGTIGAYMEEGLDTLFNLDNIKRVKPFFTNYVSGRGYLPAIRVGTQPYGILPTSALQYFQCTSDDSVLPTLTEASFANPAAIENDLQIRFDVRLKKLLELMNGYWTSIRDEIPAGETIKRVKHNADIHNASNTQAYFMGMLGLNASSAETYYRHALNVAARMVSGDTESFNINYNDADPYSPNSASLVFRDHILEGNYLLSDNFADERNATSLAIKYDRVKSQFLYARIYYMRSLEKHAQLLGLKIDHRELSESIQAPSPVNSGTTEERLQARAEIANYVDWMLDNNPWDVHASNQFTEPDGLGNIKEGMRSKSLLFMLLRHSLLCSYSDTMLKILEHEGLLSQKIRKIVGQSRHYFTAINGHQGYVTRWNYLFGKIAPMHNVLGNSMNTSNSFYAYMNNNNHYLNRYLSPVHTSVFNNYPQHNNHLAYVNELTATKNAIRKLKDIPTAQLDLLLSEHLDLCTYRLDAWYLGLVNKRLTEHRKNHVSGIYIGSYGWVENLKRGPVRQLAQHLPSGIWKSGDGPVYTDSGNQGYIHTPSLNHAITAAILRAGFKANEHIAETENQMAVNLSSARVRAGLNLLNGIQSGQEPSALLGYQFERGLHERYTHLGLELDEFIYDFRELFPLSPAVDETASLPEELARTQVVNGADLLDFAQSFVEDQGGSPNKGDSLYQALKAFEVLFWSTLANTNLSSANNAEKDAMLREIDRMADAFDALGDLCISESVYQIAQGNHVRASAILDKLAKGDIPNEIQIANTPETGTVLTQKTALFVPRIASPDHLLTNAGPDANPLDEVAVAGALALNDIRPAGWDGTYTPRALMEPSVNKFIGEIIGDPRKIKCLCSYTVVTTSSSAKTFVNLSLRDLDVQPLDVMHLFATGALNGGTELNARIANYVRSQITLLPVDFEGTADDVPVEIYFTERDASWDVSDLSFYEKSGQLFSLRELLTASGILAADHLHIPGEAEVSANEIRNQDVNELLIRITNGEARMKQVYTLLQDYFATVVTLENASTFSFTNNQIDSLRELLRAGAQFGIPSSLPELQYGYGNKTGQSLMNSAAGTYKAMDDRLKRAAIEITNGKNTALSNNARVDSLVAAASIIMEPSFRVWPQFHLRNATELGEQLTLDTAHGLLRTADAQALDTWMQTISRVRKRMAILDSVQMHSFNFGYEFSELKPVQLPFSLDGTATATDHWLGISFPSDYTPSEDKLSIAILNATEVTSNSADLKVALLVDEWVEIIPVKERITGLTFNYNQPDAKAPNTILLAVTPKVTGSWSWDNLMWTLHDTLELSKNRAVEPEHLENTVFGQILPGILTEIVPPNFVEAGDEGAGDANPLWYQVVTDFKFNNDTYEEETSI